MIRWIIDDDNNCEAWLSQKGNPEEMGRERYRYGTDGTFTGSEAAIRFKSNQGKKIDWNAASEE